MCIRDRMSTYVQTDTSSIQALSQQMSTDAFNQAFWDYLKANAAKLSYQIDSTQVDGEKATVKVTCKYIDCLLYTSPFQVDLPTASYPRPYSVKQVYYAIHSLQ